MPAIIVQRPGGGIVIDSEAVITERTTRRRRTTTMFVKESGRVSFYSTNERYGNDATHGMHSLQVNLVPVAVVMVGVRAPWFCVRWSVS